MSHPKRERDRQGQQNRCDSREKGQVGRPPFDDGAQPAARAHQDAVEMLRGKSEFPA